MVYWNRSLISSVETPPSLVDSSGIFDLNSQLIYTNVQIWPGSALNVVTGSLLHLDAGQPASYSGTGTSWNDLSGNAHNASLVNGTNFVSSSGGYFQFDGVNDYVSLPSAGLNSSTVFDGSNNFSVNVWFNPGSFPSDTLSSSSPLLFVGRPRNVFLLFGDSGAVDRLHFRAAQVGGYNSPVNNGSSLSANTWYNVCFTYDATSGYVAYQNGTATDSSSQTGFISGSGTATPLIGTLQGSTRFYDGKLAALQIYTKVLTASEVLQNFNSIKYRYGL